MKRKWIGIMAALALVAAAPVQVQAEEFSGGDDWNVTFDGEKLNSTFKNADIDDATNQRSSIAGPEESYLNKEREEILIEMINSILSDKEKLVYYTRVNLDGNKNMPFEKVAETLNMPLKEVKRLFNSAICRLSTNPDFLRDFGGKRSQERKRTADNTIRLHQNLESKLKEQGEYLLKKFKNK